MDYEILINKAITYIIKNIDEQILVADVAEHCNISRYHFSRIFKSIVGESVYQFIKRIKLEQAAMELSIDNNKSITDIANKFGYESPNFNHAFKNQFQMTPTDFRKNRYAGNFLNSCSLYHREYQIQGTDHFNENIKYKVIEDIEVYYKRYFGNYKDSAKYWENFINSYTEGNVDNYGLYEITYNDPTYIDENTCIIDICITSNKSIKGLSKQVIKGGKFGVYKYIGSNKGIFSAYQGILNNWILDNKIELRDCPIFVKYLDVKDEELELEIYIPVK